MSQIPNRERTNYRFRIFLLNLLNGREMTSTEIRKSVARDYKMQKFTEQEIRHLLVIFQRNMLVSRKKIQGPKIGRCKFTFITTDRGRKRMEWYRLKLKEQEEL